VPVMRLKTSIGRKSFLLIQRDFGSKMPMAGSSMSVVNTEAKTVTCITRAPSSRASSVKVPELAHMMAARAMRPYARFLLIFRSVSPFGLRGISVGLSRIYLRKDEALLSGVAVVRCPEPG
jgi:hypothetical protein